MGIRPAESKDSGISEVRISRAALDALLAEAKRAHPLECCGLLLGSNNQIEQAVPTANVHPDQAKHFEIDPQALVDAHRAARAGGPEVAGCYHSHPTGVAEPSAADRAEAAGDGRVWAIVAGEDLRIWRDTPEGLCELSYSVPAR
jgi:proteasome lid subunit RPN8/RPN11